MWAALPRRGAVAQMGERCNRTAEVRGSIPLSSTSLPGLTPLDWQASLLRAKVPGLEHPNLRPSVTPAT